MIISNPPYLPIDLEGEFVDDTIYGGKEGIEMTIRLLNSVLPLLDEKGKILLLRSSLSNTKKMDNLIDELFYNMRILSRKKLFFESLEILELSDAKNQC